MAPRLPGSPGQAFGLLEDLIRDRYRCFHTTSITVPITAYNLEGAGGGSPFLVLPSNDMPLSRERRHRCSLYLDLPAARRLQRLVRRSRQIAPALVV
jgi:hypothetical protein